MTTYQGHADQRWGPTTYAQHGDDLMLLNLCELLGIYPGTEPTWLDVGCHHPTTISNTRLLYDRGYHGVNVDANSHLMLAFAGERPRDTNVCTAVGIDAGRYPFHVFHPDSGRNTLSQAEVDRVRPVMGEPLEVAMVQVVTLNQLVDQQLGRFFPPILLLDVEGLDFDILNATRFDPHPPQVIVVETRLEDTLRMVQVGAWKGYRPLVRMGENLFLVRVDLHDKALGLTDR